MSLLALHSPNPLARLCSPSHSGGPEELFTLPSSSEEIAPGLFLPDFVGVVHQLYLKQCHWGNVPAEDLLSTVSGDQKLVFTFQ